MRAIVVHGTRDFRLEERPDPVPGREQLLVRPLVNGLCFTDKHLFNGHIRRSKELVIGHEFSARIVAVGSAVADWQVGETVSVDPRLRCGVCLACRAGLEMLCEQGGFLGVTGADGGLADLCVVDPAACYRLPANCSPLGAACVEAACCATRAVRSGVFAPGDNVLVLGLDDYGLNVVQWLKGRGGQIVVADPSSIRRSTALEMGADTAFDPSADDLVSKVRARMPVGADVVVVSLEDYVVEANDYIVLAHRLARIQGTVVMLRAYGQAPFAKIQPSVAWIKELTIRHFGNFFGNEPARGGKARGDWQVTLDAIAAGTITAPPPNFRIVGFSGLQAPGAIGELFDSLPGGSSKILIDMDG